MERIPITNRENLSTPERQEGLGFLVWPFYFIILLWLVFWLDSRYMLGLYHFGILPRNLFGLVGVFASPLIHGSLAHLSNNTLPLLVLGAGLYYFYPRIAGIVVISSWLLSGLLVWFIGRENYHIGASGLIYALAAFIFLSGLLRKQPNLLALSLLVVFLYGSLVWGIFPVEESVSWEAHLSGGISGLLLAIRYRNTGPATKKYSWDNDEEVLKVEEPSKPEPPIGVNGHSAQEAWEEYTHSQHGIHYIYQKGNNKGDRETS